MKYTDPAWFNQGCQCPLWISIVKFPVSAQVPHMYMWMSPMFAGYHPQRGDVYAASASVHSCVSLHIIHPCMHYISVPFSFAFNVATLYVSYGRNSTVLSLYNVHYCRDMCTPYTGRSAEVEDCVKTGSKEQHVRVSKAVFGASVWWVYCYWKWVCLHLVV